jgi:type IV secretory pathway protease TraF
VFKGWPIMIRRVQGHSMVPVLPPGTLVFGLRWFSRLKPDKVIIFVRDNRETVKRIDHLNGEDLYVLGDHSETSTDSRHYGVVPHEAVEAIVVWPRTHKVVAEDLELAKSKD